MGFFKLLTGIVAGIAAFSGSIIHQAAPRSDRTPPAPRVEQDMDQTGSPVQFSAVQTESASTTAPSKDAFVIGTITDIASSTITLDQEGVPRIVAIEADTRITANLTVGQAVIAIGVLEQDGSITATSIQDRNPEQKDAPLPASIGE